MINLNTSIYYINDKKERRKNLMDSNSLTNETVQEVCSDISEDKKIKDELNKLYAKTYQSMLLDYNLHTCINAIQCVATSLNDNKLIDHLNEIRTILLLLTSYRNQNCLANISAPVVFSHIREHLSDILSILKDYKDTVGELINITEPECFTCPNEIGDPISQFTISLSLLCNDLKEVVDGLWPLILDTANKANEIIGVENDDE